MDRRYRVPAARPHPSSLRSSALSSNPPPGSLRAETGRRIEGNPWGRSADPSTFFREKVPFPLASRWPGYLSAYDAIYVSIQYSISHSILLLILTAAGREQLVRHNHS